MEIQAVKLTKKRLANILAASFMVDSFGQIVYSFGQIVYYIQWLTKGRKCVNLWFVNHWSTTVDSLLNIIQYKTVLVELDINF